MRREFKGRLGKAGRRMEFTGATDSSQQYRFHNQFRWIELHFRKLRVLSRPHEGTSTT
jgi:hypothetical protein